MKALRLYVTVAFSLLALTAPSFAALLGVNVGFPKIAYNNINNASVTYNPVTHLFSVTSPPTSVTFSSVEASRAITGTRNLSIQILVDNTGVLIGGTAGDDLIITGTVSRIVSGVTNVYTGVLLTGEVIAFGFLDSGTTDQYEVRFTPTGGALAGFFTCGTIGINITSENSTFPGNFLLPFTGRAKGNVGPEDITPPSITCPSNIVVECHGHTNGLPGAYVTYPDPVVSDNCDPSPTVTCTPPSGSFFSLPHNVVSTNYVVTCVVRDAAGNSNSCSFIITAQDTLPPEFADTNNPVIAPGNDLSHPIVLTNDPGKCYATYTFEQPLAVDNCCPLIINASVSAIDENGTTIVITDLGNGFLQGQFPVNITGSNVVTITASDERGNTSQHQVAILVLDKEAPTIICPTNQIVECTGGPVYFQEPVVLDNCPSCPQVVAYCTPTNGSVLGTGTTTITCVAIDCSGNSNQCSFTVTVQDTTPPSISCPSDATVECGQSTAPSATGTATATDGCDSSPFISYSDLTSGSCPTIIHRTWMAVDHTGNSNQCTQTITVQDTTPPSVSCPPDVTLECGQSTAPGNTGTATATDACGSISSLTYSDVTTGTCPVVIHRTWKALDACGNPGQCIQTITVRDTTPPSVFCPPDVTLECGQSTAPGNTGTATASDTCGSISSLTYHDVTTGTCPVVIHRTWTALDACNNPGQCTQTITVRDTTKPVLTGCPNDVTIGSTNALPAPATVTAADSCAGTLPVTFTQTTNGTTVVRTWTAVDPCGNTNSCTQFIARTGGCGLTQGYWKNHASAWPVSSITVGCVNYTVSQAIAVLQTPPRGDATYSLFDQLVSAKLNALKGADTSCLGTTIADSDAFLCAHPIGSKPAGSVNTVGVNLAATLDNYNNGRLACAAHCGDDVPTVKPKFNKTDDPFHPNTTNAVVNQTVVAKTNGVVTYSIPNGTSEYDWNVSVTATPASGSVMGPGDHTINMTASDSYGTTTTTNFTVTVLSPLQVVFESPLSDGNVPNDTIPGTDNIANNFKVGQTIVNKVSLKDVNGNDVTSSAAVTVRIDVVELDIQNPRFAVDLPEYYSGQGDAGSIMALTGGKYQYNLQTSGFETGTVNNGRFFISHVSVYYNSAPTVLAGEEDAQLESK